MKEIIGEYKLNHHPHITEATFTRDQKNYIFLPDEWLFEDLKIPGYGYFTKLNDSLLLSNSKISNIATWKLPSFFYKNLTQVHQNTWEHTRDEFCTVKTGIGQEFVTQLTDKGEEWLRKLFLQNTNNIFSYDSDDSNVKMDLENI